MLESLALRARGAGIVPEPADAQPRPALSVVSPCFNEQENVAELLRRLLPVCEAQAPGSFEIVLVNDGSTDLTWARLVELAGQHPELVAVNLSRNHGHQLALTAGLALCTGQRVLIVDADLQDPPELLGDMWALMDAGADVVYGQRERRLGESLFKRASAGVFYRMLDRLTDVRIPLDTGDFRLMSRRALDVLLAMPEQHRFVRGMVSWLGMTQVPLRYVRDARFAGETKYPIRRMVRFALDAITGFSVKPLRFASYAGALTGMASLALLGYSAWAWFAASTVRGWTSLMAVVLLLGSVQLFVLGLIGEYLGRLYLEAKRRPLFVIERVVRGGSDAVPALEHPMRLPVELPVEMPAHYRGAPGARAESATASVS